ncbi:MAG: hypothetical protein ACYTHN_22310, partial [Planctomycetota bacterium]
MACRGSQCIAFLLFLAAVIALPPSAWAGEGDSRRPEPLQIKDFLYNLDRGLRTGPLSLHAYLAEFFAYNDNLLLSEDDRTADFLSDTMAGTRIDMRYGHFKGHLLGEVEYVKGIQTTEYDHYNATANLDGGWTSRWGYLEFHEKFRYEGRAENLYHTDLGNWLTFMTNDAGLQFGLKLARVGVELSGSITYWMFLKDKLKYMNHYEIPLSLKLSYNWRKLRLFLTGDFGMVTFLDEYSDGTKTYRLNDYMYYGGQVG